MENFTLLTNENINIRNGVLLLNQNHLFAYIFDENSVADHDVEIQLNSNKDIDLIIILRNKTAKVNYVITENTRGKITLLCADEDVVAMRNFAFEANANITFLAPDFTSGSRALTIVTNLVGKGAIADWNLATFSKNQEKRIYHISFNHYGDKSKADMKNYGVNLNESTLIFSGSSTIYEDVKGSETHQTARIIVFDPASHAQADPILNIYHNDVIAASHAATVGQVNREHLFYLTSRGINEENAKRLITKGYLQPIIAHIDDEQLQTSLINKLEGVM